ncbi:SRPBCC domain-containing protein [Sphingobacterium humi]|uniref:SRPBCC domain-containing protein n=1 Tax=Sphingobacterium humi TaxID=1796905 RepID=A0A6N8L0K1_9SPHI|nr:SRPBCC domain-containing protein [Sphingobacterium humi]MVZ63270.1 SRPBCC domain-containing protein [Sphingobacterium humi]
MKEQIMSEIVIQAPLAAVWKVLADFAYYPNWSPTIQQFEGIPEEGKQTKVWLQQPGGTRIKMNPIFLRIAKEQEIRWKGKLFLAGLFDGEHYFVLKPLANGQTLLIQGELFSGVLVPFLRKMIKGNTLAGFNLFNQALKKEVEGSL